MKKMYVVGTNGGNDIMFQFTDESGIRWYVVNTAPDGMFGEVDVCGEDVNAIADELRAFIDADCDRMMDECDMNCDRCDGMDDMTADQVADMVDVMVEVY